MPGGKPNPMREFASTPIYEAWKLKSTMTADEAQFVLREIDTFSADRLRSIQPLFGKEPYRALAQLTQLTAFFNAAAALNPNPAPALALWMKTLSSALSQIAQSLQAEGYSVGVSAPPLAVSVTLNFRSAPPSSGATGQTA